MAGPHALDALLAAAGSLGITASGTETVVGLTDAGAREELRAVMAVRSLPGMVCACAGEARLDVRGPDGRSLAVVALHHGVTLSWEGWDGDALLADGPGLLAWLDRHGVPEPLRLFREAEARRAAAAREREDWVAAVPGALRGLTERMLQSAGGSELRSEAAGLLAEAVPDPVVRVQAVLAWYAAGSGRYSGYPVYEDLPGAMLGEVPIGEIAAALEDPRAGARHEAGAVRHLIGWRSRKRIRRDIAALPAPLRARLLAAARTSPDRATRVRAEERLGG
ncbi:hypothetical protein [Nocardiopsis sp. NPDC057823]|uniref:hypothetical protein n=1 Tax=Nocardiopsis sp. NPDC057823 TaxID=3346256 RepID=UPI00366ED791